MHVLHACDNRKCGNPAHLSVGTNRDNWFDAVSKGRPLAAMPGEANFNAKLTEQAVREILQSSASSQELALRHGVHKETIARVRRGVLWKSVHASAA
jgi:hypothetical protein